MLNNSFINKIKSNLVFIIPLTIILFYLSPYLILGQDSFVLIHDYLDSSHVIFRALFNSNRLFASSDSIIETVFNGVPRHTFPSELSLMTWLHYIFGSFNAHVLNQIFMRLVGFFGMYLLLKKHFSEDNDHHNRIIIAGVALAFALLPFYPNRGLGIAGMPLALYAFLNLRHNDFSYKDFLIILLLPFYSSFLNTTVFFLAAMSVIFIYDLALKRKFNAVFLIGIALMSLSSVVGSYRMFYWYFVSESYVSHLSERTGAGIGLLEVLSSSADIFLTGQYHNVSLHGSYIVLSAVLALLVAFINRKQLALTEKRLLLFLGIAIIISMLYGLNSWGAILEFRESFFLTRAFQFRRFISLFPLIWHIIFFLSLIIIFKCIQFGRTSYSRSLILAGILIICQVGLMFTNSEGYPPSVKELGKRVVISSVALVDEKRAEQLDDVFYFRMTYREFFAEDLFAEIDEYISKNKSDYRVVSIGMHPSIALYNGFYTLDAYRANYPLDYKKDFREIISAELDKNSKLQRYFDDWGNRCYIFVDDLNGNTKVTKDSDIKIKNLDLNTRKLYEMGGRYIFSAAEIINDRENDLELLSVFEDDIAAWRIYLYEVKYD